MSRGIHGDGGRLRRLFTWDPAYLGEYDCTRGDPNREKRKRGPKGPGASFSDC